MNEYLQIFSFGFVSGIFLWIIPFIYNKFTKTTMSMFGLNRNEID